MPTASGICHTVTATCRYSGNCSTAIVRQLCDNTQLTTCTAIHVVSCVLSMERALGLNTSRQQLG
jgi:hypothetical protein